VVRSDVPFAALRQLLLNLGFVEQVVKGKHLAFYHRASDTIFLFRRYRPRDRATMVDVLSTRKHLDERGVLTAESFDARLRKASA
jgi:predicted RNA binding protein YcfA (HicA-like mRNA interferase family)